MNTKKLAELLKNGHVDITSGQRLGYLLDILPLSMDLEPLESQLKKYKTSRRLAGGIEQATCY